MRQWNLGSSKVREECAELLASFQPYFVIGSPRCESLEELEKVAPNTERYEKLMKEATDHLRCCAEVYGEQFDRGRLFLHEQNKETWNWEEVDFMKSLADLEGVFCLEGEMEEYPGEKVWNNIYGSNTGAKIF